LSDADSKHEAPRSLPVYALPERYRDPNHWIRGVKSKKGAVSDKLIYIAVGHALSNWERVESAAAALFAHFVESKSIAAQRAYGSITGARARQAALSEASETYFLLRQTMWSREARDKVSAMKECSEKLIHNYGGASARRNDIAHGVAQDLSGATSKQLSWYLVAPNYQSQRTANWIPDDVRLRTKTGMKIGDQKARFAFNKIYYKNSDYVYGMEEVKVFAGKFAYLHVDMLDFLFTIDPSRRIGSTSQLYAVAKLMSK
jgi:hypothetical protein